MHKTINDFSLKREWGPELSPDKFGRLATYKPPKRDFITIAGPCSIENIELFP